MTREYVREPPGAEDFDWRLSLATIDRSGPFSPFAGYARTLVLVDGDGIELDCGKHGKKALRGAGERFDFDGGWPVSCRLRGGPSTDLNLMYARDRIEIDSRCQRLQSAQRIATAARGETLICCLSGTLRIRAAGEMRTLFAVDAIRCDATDGEVVCESSERGGCLMFVASIRRRSR